MNKILENYQVTIELPTQVLPLIRKNKEELTSYFRLLIAAKLYEMRELSMERAAEMASLSRSDFIYSLKSLKIDVFQYTKEELMQELAIF